jgi:peptide/nickel transport system permease protein
VVRSSVIEELSGDYVRTARAKGLSERRIARRHVLPNAVLPILTLTGIEVGTALGIAVYIESVFGMSGLGRLSVGVLVGTVGLDLPFILGTIVFIAGIVVVTNLVVDTLYAIVDPRISAGSSIDRRQVGSIV